MTLLMACARTPGLADRLDVSPLPSVRRVGSRALAVLPTRAVTGGTAFRQDDLVACDRIGDVLDSARGGSLPFAALLAAAGSDGERARLRRLLSAGVLQPVLPWELVQGRDFEALATWLHRNADAAPPGLTVAVDRMAAAEAVVSRPAAPGDRTARARTAAVRSARDASAAAFAALGRPSPPWIRRVAPFHEVVANGTQPVALPAEVHADLAGTTADLAPLTWRHPVHDELVRCFVDRYGVGAHAVDLIGFLYEFLSRVDGAALGALVPQVDRATARAAGRLRGDATMAAASHALFFQVERPDVTDGEHTVVINAVHTGGLGLVGRWAAVPSLHEAIAAPLTAWTAALHPGCRVLQLAPAADWSDLQRPTVRTLPVLRAPGDLRTPAEPVEPAGLTLAHRPATGTLQVHDHDGCPVAFAHMGAVPQHLLQGVVRLLALLSNPWVLLGRVGRDRRVGGDPPGPDDRPAVQPRIARGRVVWARARWSFPAVAVPRPTPGAPAFEHFAEVRRWAARHGLPAESFVGAVCRSSGRLTVDKPQWLGLDHPHAVWAALGRCDANVSTVDITEALPGRGRHLGPVATEYLGLVRHA
jgi:hypothetical protein